MNRDTDRVDVAKARAALAPGGVLRAAINFGNPVLVRRDTATGAPVGVVFDLATALAAELGVPLELPTFEAARHVHESATADKWDVCFLAIDPIRAEVIDFTRPYHIIEGTYLVDQGSPIRVVDDVDRTDKKVLVGAGSAYDLFLTRELKAAAIERVDSAVVIDRFAEGGYDACGGIRQPLAEFAAKNSDYRVLEDSFMDIRQAMGTPRRRDHAGVRFLDRFVADRIDSGFVAKSVSKR
jgi:polar amino acid transport system substrate-binding protein